VIRRLSRGTGAAQDVFTGRTLVVSADLLDPQATAFPSHHGGFLDGECARQPEAFGCRLREVLDDRRPPRRAMVAVPRCSGEEEGR